jgi:hypothetical protein
VEARSIEHSGVVAAERGGKEEEEEEVAGVVAAVADAGDGDEPREGEGEVPVVGDEEDTRPFRVESCR